LRVSTKRQLDTAVDIDPDGLSIATQRDECLAKVAQIGAQIIREPFIEPGNSAKTINDRPVFRELLAYVREHPGIKYLITYNRARAFRNHFDAAIVQVQLKKLGIRLVTVKDDFGEGPHAVAMEGMLDIMNGLQNTLQGLDIQTKMLHKAVHGGTNGLAPVGYLNVRVEHEGKMINTVELDPKRAPLIRKAFELYATGDYGLERLEATMADLGLTARAIGRWPERPVSFKWLHGMLQDPYYLGYVPYKGELYAGRHEPIVDQALFDRVQEVKDLRSRNGQRDRVLQHYLKGVLFCGRCERHERTSRLIYTEAKGHNGTRYGYFLCRGRQDGVCDLPYLPAEGVEQAILDHYVELKLPADFATEVRHRLETALDVEQRDMKTLHAGLTKRLKDLDAKANRLLDLAADGTLPLAKIKSKVREIESDRKHVEAGLSTTATELAVGVEVLLGALDLVAEPARLYREGNDDIRRNLNQTFFHQIYLDEEGVSGDALNPPFADLREAFQLRSARRANVVKLTSATTKRGLRNAEAPNRARGTGSTPYSSSGLGPTLADVLSDPGSSKASLVELPGIEPVALPGNMRSELPVRSVSFRFIPLVACGFVLGS
jgi:site-specific DNA recombinase